MRRLALLVVVLAAGGCFSPDRPVCSYACSDTAPKCPDDYECRSDGYCHRVGTTAACGFSDAAMPQDLSVADQSVPVTTDMASTD
jgi:hypothetical protein